MKPDPHYYHVQTGEVSMTVIGGPLLPGDDGHHVWITKPTGEPLFQVPREAVHVSSPEEAAQRLAEDRQWARARN
jgi:hypothetical protein